MATLKDVAELAGVSVKTVSNVVNGYAFVKAENRQRVEEALAATGYRPNIGARNLRRGRSGFLGLVLPELGVPYFAELAGLVLEAAQEHEWSVLIEQTLGTRSGERDTLAALGPHMIDGAIISPEALRANDLAELATRLPVVLIGEHTVDLPIDRVVIDNVAAAHAATRHLIGSGRTRIAAIGAHPTRDTAAQRLKGYTLAHAEAHLPIDDDLIATALLYHRREGYEAMTALLNLPNPPDAVFCFNDMLAIGAMRAAADRGVRVPHDLAVAGFDNTEEGQFSQPTLTTIAPDKAAIAKTAVDLLRSHIDGNHGPAPEHVQPPFTLLVRQSSQVPGNQSTATAH